MSIVDLFVALVLFCLVVWAARSLLAAFSVPDPIATVVYVAIVVIAVLYVLGFVGGGAPLVRLR